MANNDHVSLANLWCQKHGNIIPKYSFEYNSGWVCNATADWIRNEVCSEAHASKKIAKQECAARVYSHCQKSTKKKLVTEPQTCIIIDGDQRADCWKWLADPDTEWEDLTIKVYTGPSTPIVSSTRKIEHIQAQSPSRDAADAKILMDLGAFLALKQYKKYILVSSDHILVQAALDSPSIEGVTNLDRLKWVLKCN